MSKFFLPKIFFTVLALFFVFFVFPKTIQADLGPKPDVYIYLYENGVPVLDPKPDIEMLGCVQERDEKTWEYYGECKW